MTFDSPPMPSAFDVGNPNAGHMHFDQLGTTWYGIDGVTSELHFDATTGNLTLSASATLTGGTINGATIVGGTMETAASPNERIVLSGSTLTAYDANNHETWQLRTTLWSLLIPGTTFTSTFEVAPYDGAGTSARYELLVESPTDTTSGATLQLIEGADDGTQPDVAVLQAGANALAVYGHATGGTQDFINLNAPFVVIPQVLQAGRLTGVWDNSHEVNPIANGGSAFITLSSLPSVPNFVPGYMILAFFSGRKTDGSNRGVGMYLIYVKRENLGAVASVGLIGGFADGPALWQSGANVSIGTVASDGTAVNVIVTNATGAALEWTANYIVVGRDN